MRKTTPERPRHMPFVPLPARGGIPPVRAGFIAGALFTALLAAALLLSPGFTGPAHAQFICDSTTPGGADGATAGTFAVACGTNAAASGTTSTALGNGASATGILSTAVGHSSTANNTSSTAVGNGSTASGDGSAAYGAGSNAGGTSSVAIGLNASAAGNNSAAFGTGATVTRTSQQVFGTATNTYTMPGITSATSTAAQTGTTQIVTSDASGNLATSTLAGLGLASSGDISAINSQLASINNRIDDLYSRSDKANAGVAMAFAMAGVPSLMPGEHLAMTFNYGTFQGQNGLAINAAYRLTDNMQLTGGIGYGANEGIVGGRAGLRVAW